MIERNDTRRIMLTVAVCLAPGLMMQAVLIDFTGVLANILTAAVVALVTERVCLSMTGVPFARQLTGGDASALVTGLILAAALPPGAIGPVAFATALALGLGKHAYGGLGNNVFNPAMVGYAIVLVSFPAAIASWPAVDGTDALTGATVLTLFKYRGAATVEGIWSDSAGFGQFAGADYEWVALTYGLGAAVLFARHLAAWRPAAGMILALILSAAVGYDNGSSVSLGSPSYHLFAGGVLLAAGFVVTDPVTHPTSHRGQWLFGISVGLLIFAIRAWGNYPDGIAFAVLLGNALAPYLDRRLAPRTSHD